MACNLVDPVSWTGCTTEVLKPVAEDAFAAAAHDFGQAADSAINWLWVQVGSATAVSLSGTAFETDLAMVATIAAVVAVGLFVVQVGLSALRRDPGGLARALKGMVVAFVGGGVAVAIVSLLLTATDDLSTGVVQVATGGSVQQMGEALLATGTISSASANPAVTVVLAVAALAAVMLVWAALMVRKALIVVTAVFAPLAFAGSLADITVGWTRRWVETTLALVASKLLLVLVFMVGLGLFSGMGQAGGGAGQGVTQVLTGLLVLALAGFTPWVALRLVHFVGDQAHHVHMLASTSSAGASRAYSAARKAEAWVGPAARLATTAPQPMSTGGARRPQPRTGPVPPSRAQAGVKAEAGGRAPLVAAASPPPTGGTAPEQGSSQAATAGKGGPDHGQ